MFFTKYRFIILSVISLLLTACIAVLPSTTQGPRIETLYVGPELVDCVGVAPQKCLQVKRDPNAEWEFFYSTIDGFTYEEGFEYELRVAVVTVANPPADASSLRYELVEIVAQTAFEIEAAENDQHLTLLDQVWYWQAYQDMAGMNDLTIADPTRYTFTLSADGTYQAQADCNSLSGNFDYDDSRLTLLPGPILGSKVRY